MFERYAIYYTPASDHPLNAFGASWLGWDLDTGQSVDHPKLPNLPMPISDITQTPRKYGFHGTVKAPFHLRDGTTQGELEEAVADFARGWNAFELGHFTIGHLGKFCALVLARENDHFAALVSDCVVALDRFRAPMTQKELKRRLAANLSARQQHFLNQWGYPYIMEEFRFHLTLTSALSEEDLLRVIQAISPPLKPLLKHPIPLSDLSLCGQGKDGNFRLIRRFALSR